MATLSPRPKGTAAARIGRRRPAKLLRIQIDFSRADPEGVGVEAETEASPASRVRGLSRRLLDLIRAAAKAHAVHGARAGPGELFARGAAGAVRVVLVASAADPTASIGAVIHAAVVPLRDVAA